jgi:hypothetical protein
MGRSLTTWFDDQGFFIIRGRLTPEEGAVVEKALRKVMESMPAPPRAKSTREQPPGEVFDHYGARQADALAQMARDHLAGTRAEHSSATIPEVIVHYELDSLTGKAGAECHLEEGIAIARSTAERIACDAAAVALIEDGKGNPLWIGRRSRVISPAMRRALMARDKGCRFPGCPNKRRLEGHHSEHWLHGGRTDMDNVLYLCKFHHHLVHGGGYSVKPAGSGFEFYRPDGSAIPSTYTPPGQSGAIRAENEKRGVMVEDQAICSGWDGERMNLGYVIDIVCLAQQGMTCPKPPPLEPEPDPPPEEQPPHYSS